jgi:hypothetical protein
MRYLLISILGLLAFFYLSALYKQLAKRVIHSSIGLVLIILGLAAIFFGSNFIGSPLNSLLGALLIGSGLGIIVHHSLSESYVISEKIEQDFVHKHIGGFDRFLEILPGAMTWIALTSPLWLSFVFPFAVAYLIIVADVYWLFNSIKIASLIIVGYRRVEKAAKEDWLAKLEQDFPDTWKDYYHLLVVPNYMEGLEILGPSYDSVAQSNYPSKNVFLAVGFEERAQQKNPQRIEEVTKYLHDLKGSINQVFTTIHPFGLENEVPGPGSNRNWMVNSAVKELKKLGIDENKVIVTTLDCDFVINKQFLAGTLHKYLSTPEEYRDVCSYTGIIFFNNNYWQAPAPMRLIASGTSFWQLAEMVGSDKYINYSSTSMNLKALLDLGLWPGARVNDDSGFYWKAYYFFKGKYKVIPNYMQIYGDAVLDVNLPRTFQNQYLQLKRWAYGVEHIPFIVKSYFKTPDIDFWDKTDKLIFVFWSYLKWGTLALFISFGGLLVPLINPQFGQSVVSHNLSVVSSWILTAAFVGLGATIYVHEKSVPKRPKSWSIFKKIWSYMQWALVPLVLVTIATFPAIDAQTSLMLGRYLEYRTTNKTRSANPS